jgi:hypothetical protein
LGLIDLRFGGGLLLTLQAPGLGQRNLTPIFSILHKGNTRTGATAAGYENH